MKSRKTTVYCRKCQTKHPASIERHGSEIFGVYSCSEREKRVQLSKDADLYERITARSNISGSGNDISKYKRPISCLIEVTNYCNLQCPLCYADNGPSQEAEYLSEEQVLNKVKEAKKTGATAVLLTGGEPTEHPNILRLVRLAAQDFSEVHMATNGCRIGTQPHFARQLKKAGLKRVGIQFDSLDGEVQTSLRGRDLTDLKKKAVEEACKAGLRVALIATVTHLNAKEIPKIVEFGLHHAPNLYAIQFQLAAKTGRYNIPDGAEFDKEEAIRILVENSPVERLGFGHFWPVPSYEPWGLSLHPDCGASAFIMTDGEEREPLDAKMSLGRLFHRMSSNSMSPSILSKTLVPFYYMLGATPVLHWKSTLGHLAGFVTGRGRRGLVQIGIGELFKEDFIDQTRIAHCPTYIATPRGYEPVCKRFGTGSAA